jgi:hypothetical protein
MLSSGSANMSRQTIQRHLSKYDKIQRHHGCIKLLLMFGLCIAIVFCLSFFVYVSNPMHEYRKIIHIDMDAFYASVEQRDNHELKGRPVIVGGDPQSRGVVAACSYEARKFGIHSAMACVTAYKRCPHAVFIRPRFDVYKSVSRLIREVFLDYTDLMEPLSLDEAFLDVTHKQKRHFLGHTDCPADPAADLSKHRRSDRFCRGVVQ